MTTTTSFSFRRVLAAGALCLGLVGAPVLSTAADAAPDAAEESTAMVMTRNQQIVVNQINHTRSNNGRRTLPTNGIMNVRATKWAEHLRGCQCLEHRAPPFGTPSGWCAAAENVGRSGNGGTLGDVHLAFLRSSDHRANILNRRWTTMGVGVARDGSGEYFVVHAFADFSC